MNFADLMKAAETLNRQRYGSHAVAEPYAMIEIACRELEALAKRVEVLEATGTATTTASDASAVIDRYEAAIERLKAERVAAIDEARDEAERAREERAKAQSLWSDIAAAVADGRRDCAEKLTRTRENLDATLDALERCTHERDEARAEVEAMRKAIMHAFPVFTESDEDECTWNECIEAAVQNLRELRRERNEAIDEVERLRAACVGSDLAEHYYRRGAEAMREACAGRLGSDAALTRTLAEHLEREVRNLPIPEEP